MADKTTIIYRKVSSWEDILAIKRDLSDISLEGYNDESSLQDYYKDHFGYNEMGIYIHTNRDVRKLHYTATRALEDYSRNNDSAMILDNVDDFIREVAHSS